MKISRQEARRIADLAHLEFDDAGLDRMAAEMTTILGYIEKLREVDVPAEAGVPSEATPMRADEVRPSLDRDAVMRNAPASSRGFFVVPKVIE